MSLSRLSSFGLFVCYMVGFTASTRAQETPKPAEGEYHVLKSYKVGGDGFWDYIAVDADGRRLFVTHATKVEVLNADTGERIGEIPNTPGVHGVALAPELGRGFTSNGRDNTALIFDLKTLETLGTVPTGKNPDAIVYEPTTKCVFTMNGRSNDATAIDAATGKAVGKIDLGGKPEFCVADGAGKLYANIEDKSEVVVLDPKDLKVTARWSLAPGEEPSGLAIDVKNHRLFSVCSNKLMVVLDADNGQVLSSLPIGEHVDGAAFDPGTMLAYSSNGEGTLTIVHEDSPSKFTVVQNVKTLRSARTIALDPKTHNAFLPAAKVEPPAPNEAQRRHRPRIVPDSFQVIVVGK